MFTLSSFFILLFNFHTLYMSNYKFANYFFIWFKFAKPIWWTVYLNCPLPSSRTSVWHFPTFLSPSSLSEPALPSYFHLSLQSCSPFRRSTFLPWLLPSVLLTMTLIFLTGTVCCLPFGGRVILSCSSAYLSVCCWKLDISEMHSCISRFWFLLVLCLFLLLLFPYYWLSSFMQSIPLTPWILWWGTSWNTALSLPVIILGWLWSQ